MLSSTMVDLIWNKVILENGWIDSCNNGEPDFEMAIYYMAIVNAIEVAKRTEENSITIDEVYMMQSDLAIMCEILMA